MKLKESLLSHQNKVASFQTREMMAEANLFVYQILSIFLVDVYDNKTKVGH